MVGVQTVAHVKAMPAAIQSTLSRADIERIYAANPLNPLFPMKFLYTYKGGQEYHLGLTAKHNQQYQMAAWINAPPKQGVSGSLHWKLMRYVLTRMTAL
jgi:hypothetical protein